MTNDMTPVDNHICLCDITFISESQYSIRLRLDN